jgi:hypothetical protein
LDKPLFAFAVAASWRSRVAQMVVLTGRIWVYTPLRSACTSIPVNDMAVPAGLPRTT